MSAQIIKFFLPLKPVPAGLPKDPRKVGEANAIYLAYRAGYPLPQPPTRCGQVHKVVDFCHFMGGPIAMEFSPPDDAA